MRRRRQYLRAVATGSVLTFAGCSTDSADSDENGDDTATGDGDSNGSPTSRTTDRESGGDLDEPLRIGVLAPEPASSTVGRSMRRGAEIAARRLTDESAFPTVEVVVRDTHRVPQIARNAHEELVVSESVDATTGVFANDALLELQEAIAETETIHLTTGATTPDASAKVANDYERYKYHFRPGPLNDAQVGTHLGAFATDRFPEMGWDSVALLFEDFQWTRPLEERLVDELRESSVDITHHRRYPKQTTDFAPIFDAVEQSGADAAVVGMAHTALTALVQWTQTQRPFGLGGMITPAQFPEYYDAAPDAVAYSLTHTLVTPRSESTEQTRAFVTDYRDEYDSVPPYTAFTTYDAVMQYASVVADGGTKSADAVVAGLEASSYTGTYGTFEYHGCDHEFAHDPTVGSDAVTPVVQQWQPDDQGGGTQTALYPDQYAAGEYRQPPWI